MKKALILNTDKNIKLDFSKYSTIVGVEKGSLFLFKNKIDSYHVSDFDSVTKKEQEQIVKHYEGKVFQLGKEKDFTDLEYAIKFLLDKGYKNNQIEVIINISGVQRPDHAFMQLFMANKYPEVKFIVNNDLFIGFPKGTHTLDNVNNKFKCFSLFAFEKSIVSITGAKYNLSKQVIDKDSITSCISNQFTKGKVKITSNKTFVVVLTNFN